MKTHDISPSPPMVKIYFETMEYLVPEGISVAAALMGPINAEYTSINAITGERRAPNCFMGVCFECLVKINGVPGQQACMTQVAEGMRISRQPVTGEMA